MTISSIYALHIYVDAKRIKALRKRLDWTQPEMAAYLGLSGGVVISHWENNVNPPRGLSVRFLRLLELMSDAELEKTKKSLRRIHAETFEDD